MVRFDDTTSATIVGVVDDIKDHDLKAAPVSRVYLSYLQRPLGEAEGLRFEIRTAGDPALLTADVRRTVVGVDAQLPITDLGPLTVSMRESLRTDRLLARLATGFGVLALILAAIGLYGVMAYAVARRTAEIGLRVSLGAEQHQVATMVVSDALRLVGCGDRELQGDAALVTDPIRVVIDPARAIQERLRVGGREGIARDVTRERP